MTDPDNYVVWVGKIEPDNEGPDYRLVRTKSTNAVSIEEGGLDAMGAEAWTPVPVTKPEWMKTVGMALDQVVAAYGNLYDQGGGQ